MKNWVAIKTSWSKLLPCYLSCLISVYILVLYNAYNLIGPSTIYLYLYMQKGVISNKPNIFIITFFILMEF